MRFQVYKDAAREWRWRLLAHNGQVIAVSGEGYKRKAACLHGIHLVRWVGDEAKLVEVSKA
jgi:uncharacterized protein YegP (UPF0339 family)